MSLPLVIEVRITVPLKQIALQLFGQTPKVGLTQKLRVVSANELLQPEGSPYYVTSPLRVEALGFKV